MKQMSILQYIGGKKSKKTSKKKSKKTYKKTSKKKDLIKKTIKKIDLTKKKRKKPPPMPKIGDKVQIAIKPYKGKIAKGIVKKVLTKVKYHTRGHKVLLESGEIGRVFL
jgi:uncharacterized repeat protein (TIGR03833 family)